MGFWLLLNTDLREDKQYLIDHPGATPISTAQASRNFLSWRHRIFLVPFWYSTKITLNIGQGEELKKAIGAAGYIECSSKTQQVQISFCACS